MAKKKQTLGEMYSEILSRPDMSGRWEKPIKLSECTCIGSVFPDESKAHLYRYDMLMKHTPYLFVDMRMNKVIVVIRADCELEDEVRKIAELYGGEPYNVSLK